MTIHELTMDGYLDDTAISGGSGELARFRLVISATDEAAEELVLPCSVADPVMAAGVRDLSTGDQLRVTGYLRMPLRPNAPMWLAVHRLEVLHTAPLLNLTADVDQAAVEPSPEDTAVPLIDRYADYLALHDPAGRTYIWHTTGAAVGDTDDPAAIGSLIAAYERRTGAGER